MAKTDFLNFTGLPDDMAKDVLQEAKELVDRSETQRENNIERAEDAVEIWNNNFWDEKDEKYFEEKFNVTPYEFPVARAPLNKLITIQQASRYKFSVVPTDKFSYTRHREGREKFVKKHAQEFDNVKSAQEYYDRYYDDEIAEAIATHYDTFRKKNNAKYVESDCLKNGIITGLDFMKTTYSKKDDPDGEVVNERKSVRQMIWDTFSNDPLLQDVDYIGEVHKLFKYDLISMFPNHKKEIEKRFGQYSSQRQDKSLTTNNWENYYDFDSNLGDVKLKVSEMWYLDTFPRWQIVNKETGHKQTITDHKTKEEVTVWLAERELDRMKRELRLGNIDPDFFEVGRDKLISKIEKIVEKKYNLRKTQKKVWQKCLFTHNALLEHKVSPLPHGSHPYTPYFAQFIEGKYAGIIDDIKDILLSYNKAVMFREIMQANSAKGVLFVDKGAVNKSGYSMSEIREMWTEIGGVIDLDLKGGRRLSDVFQQVNNMGDGLAAIQEVIGQLERMIYRTIGINDAMLGFTSGEASAAQVRTRIASGQGTNGLIYDNFDRALKTHVKNKVIPLVVADLYTKQPEAIKGLAGSRQKWIEMSYDEYFEDFVEGILDGDFQLELKKESTDQQTEQQYSAMLLELAQSRPDQISLQAALEYSNFPQSHDFIKRNNELMRQQTREKALRQIDLRKIQQIMAEQGVDEDMAAKIMQKAQKKAAIEKESNKQQVSQGSPTIQRLSSEQTRQQRIEQTDQGG